MKKIGGTVVFTSALIVEALVITIHILNQKGIVNLSFLWLNVVGALGVILLSATLAIFLKPGLNKKSRQH